MSRLMSRSAQNSSCDDRPKLITRSFSDLSCVDSRKRFETPRTSTRVRHAQSSSAKLPSSRPNTTNASQRIPTRHERHDAEQLEVLRGSCTAEGSAWSTPVGLSVKREAPVDRALERERDRGDRVEQQARCCGSTPASSTSPKY